MNFYLRVDQANYVLLEVDQVDQFRALKMLGPLLFVYRGFLVIFFVLQKKKL